MMTHTHTNLPMFRILSFSASVRPTGHPLDMILQPVCNELLDKAHSLYSSAIDVDVDVDVDSKLTTLRKNRTIQHFWVNIIPKNRNVQQSSNDISLLSAGDHVWHLTISIFWFILFQTTKKICHGIQRLLLQKNKKWGWCFWIDCRIVSP